MGVSTTDTYSGPYAANGSTVAFPFTFKAVSAADVAVIFRAMSGVETVADEASFTTTLATEGGTVTFAVAPTATVGDVYVVSEPSFLQSTAFASGQPFLPAVINDVNDLDVVRALYLKDRSDRAFTVPLGESAGSLPPLSDRAGKLALFGTDGGLLAIDTLGIGNPDFQDDGLWNASDPVTDDGVWG